MPRRLMRSHAFRLVVVGGGALAALLWLKLRIVSGIPKTAYADPAEARGQGPAPDADATAQASADGAPPSR